MVSSLVTRWTMFIELPYQMSFDICRSVVAFYISETLLLLLWASACEPRATSFPSNFGFHPVILTNTELPRGRERAQHNKMANPESFRESRTFDVCIHVNFSRRISVRKHVLHKRFRRCGTLGLLRPDMNDCTTRAAAQPYKYFS